MSGSALDKLCALVGEMTPGDWAWTQKSSFDDEPDVLDDDGLTPTPYPTREPHNLFARPDDHMSCLISTGSGEYTTPPLADAHGIVMLRRLAPKMLVALAAADALARGLHEGRPTTNKLAQLRSALAAFHDATAQEIARSGR